MSHSAKRMKRNETGWTTDPTLLTALEIAQQMEIVRNKYGATMGKLYWGTKEGYRLEITEDIIVNRRRNVVLCGWRRDGKTYALYHIAISTAVMFPNERVLFLSATRHASTKAHRDIVQLNKPSVLAHWYADPMVVVKLWNESRIDVCDVTVLGQMLKENPLHIETNKYTTILADDVNNYPKDIIAALDRELIVGAHSYDIMMSKDVLNGPHYQTLDGKTVTLDSCTRDSRTAC